MLFTATKDLMLPATVTGSWPRPRWYSMNMWGRPLDTAMMDPWYREQFTDAHAVVVSDQERAGLDILTTGDYHLDEDVAGRSWHHYPLQRWKGLEHEELQTDKTRSPLLSYPVGTMLDSIYKTWRWPRVVGKVEHDPKNPLEYAKIWRIAQASAASRKPVKFGTCSAQVLAFFLDSHTDYDLDDKRQLTWDMAEAMNKELRQLVEAGCSVIQVEEPTLHFLARYYPEETETIDFLVDCFNREIEGLDDAEVWIHTCWGNPNMQKVFSDESYANSIEIYLERLKGRRLDDRSDRERPRGDQPLRAVQGLVEEEGRRRRRQPPVAPGGHSCRGRGPDPARPRVHPGGQAGAFDRLRLRQAGLQPPRRVLQDDGDPARAEHRARGARAGATVRPARPTRGFSGTCCPTTSRTRTWRRFAEGLPL